MLLTNGAPSQNRWILLGVPGECGRFPDPNFDSIPRLWSSSKEPAKCAEQLGNPEKSVVLLLRELVSRCLGLWVHSSIDQ